MHDFELAFGPVVDELAPDVIHAHDMHVIGVAAQAAARARGAGREVRMVYDAHEFVPGLSRYGGRTARSSQPGQTWRGSSSARPTVW